MATSVTPEDSDDRQPLPAPAPRRADLGTTEIGVAPVDRRADPAGWMAGRTLTIVATVSLLVLIITIIVCLLVWSTPALDPVQLPSEPRI